MRFFGVYILIVFAACNQQPPATLTNGKWQIIKVDDDKPTTGVLSFDYEYNPATDSTISYIEFISNKEYVVSNLYDPGNDTNEYRLLGDTLYSNNDPRDYLLIVKGLKDTFKLYNREQMVTLTLVKMKD